jgi:uncharacterized delta-60 repeat protein
MFLRWLRFHWQSKSAIPRQRSRKTRAPKPGLRPRLELLESRTVLSGGVLNPKFGIGGLVTTSFGGMDSATTVATQRDGKIVVVGNDFSVSANVPQLAVARYRKDGSLDTSFGSGGKVLTLVGAADFDFAVGNLAIRDNGKIVVAATEVDPVTSNFNVLVVQYNRDGSLDQSFGSGGVVATSLGNGTSIFVAGLALTPEGKIVVVGNASSAANPSASLTLIEYNRDGSLNQGFGSGGIVTVGLLQGPPTPDDPQGVYSNPTGTAIATDDQGRIVVGGSVSDFVHPILSLVRFNPDGGLDKTFGDQGLVTYVFGISYGNEITALTTQHDKIFAAGQATNPKSFDFDFAVEKFNSDGTPDSAFGFYGIVATDTPQESMFATGLSIDDHGDVILVGYTQNATTFALGFAMARYTPDGNLDQSFGTNGLVATFPGTGTIFGIALASNDDLLVCGEAVDPTTGNMDFALAEYLPGSPSSSSRLDENGHAHAGHHHGGDLNSKFGTGGTVTTNFGGQDSASGIATQSDGKIVVVGTDSNGTTSELAIARYNLDGSLDSTFGAGGKVLTLVGSSDFEGSVAIRPDGKIIVAALAQDPVTSQYDLAVVQLNADGSLDQNFGFHGSVLTSVGNGAYFLVSGIALEPNNRIVIVGAVDTPYFQSAGILVVEYNPDGSLNQNFGSGGIVITASLTGPGTSGNPGPTYNQLAGNAVAIDSLGRIVVGGTGINSSTFGFAAILTRYNTDGSLDQSFGFQGAVTTVFNGVPTNVFAPYGFSVTAVGFTQDGTIVAAGSAFAPSFGFFPYMGFAVEEFKADGSPVMNFGSEGVAFYGPPVGFAGQFRTTGLVVQSNGDVVVVGTTFAFGLPLTGFAMVRFDDNGNLDQGFGSGGVVTAFVANPVGPFAIAAEPNGDLVVAGTVLDTSNNFDFGLAEYLPS